MLDCVVRMTDRTLQSQPMVPCLAFGTAVVARDNSPGVLVLLGHGLGGNENIEPTKLNLHVDASLVADWTLVRCLLIRVETVLVNGMATFHDCNRSRGAEQVFAADGTIAVGGPFDTSVLSTRRDAC